MTKTEKNRQRKEQARRKHAEALDARQTTTITEQDILDGAMVFKIKLMSLDEIRAFYGDPTKVEDPPGPPRALPPAP